MPYTIHPGMFSGNPSSCCDTLRKTPLAADGKSRKDRSTTSGALAIQGVKNQG